MVDKSAGGPDSDHVTLDVFVASCVMISMSIAHATQALGHIPALFPALNGLNLTIVGVILASLMLAEIDE